MTQKKLNAAGSTGRPKTSSHLVKEHAGVSFAQRIMTFCGAVLVMTGAGAIIYGLWIAAILMPTAIDAALLADAPSPAWVFLLSNQRSVVFLLFGVVAVSLGTGLMRKAIAATAQAIADEDRHLLEPLIRDGEDKPISQYIRLVSLTGVTGVFTKFGFTGLPLATAALGVLLIFLAVSIDGDIAKQLMDLAKLVIGAFLGSFVQRRVASDGGNRPEDRL